MSKLWSVCNMQCIECEYKAVERGTKDHCCHKKATDILIHPLSDVKGYYCKEHADKQMSIIGTNRIRKKMDVVK